ncbi:MAG: tRNA lysidine(34) synthetase TilS [Jatrophihabitans sp.]
MGPSPAVAEIRRAVRVALVGGTGPVLVACSGGADSVALAAATIFEAEQAGVSAGLVTVDHALQAGSQDQARRVAGLGYELGFDPVQVIRVDVGSGGGPEAAAREARYAALDATALALDARLLLGHTLDDQAETVLLGLGRGSGPRSLAGMRAVDGRRLRPLLAVRRDITVAACAALGLPVWDDPHNRDPRFQRVRLRREVLPLLEDVLQGGVGAALARTADLLRHDLDALDVWAERALRTATTAPVQHLPGDAHQSTLEVMALAALPTAVRTRVLRMWIANRVTTPLSAERTAAVDELVTGWRGQGRIDLPGGVGVARTSGRLELVTHPRDARA